MQLRKLNPIATLAALTSLLLAGAARGAGRAPALAPVPIEHVKVDDPFWSPKRDVWRRVTIADCFDKFERDGAFANFDKIRDGETGPHAGPQWYDGLVYETITGAADFLRERPDDALVRRIDGYVARIAAAADRDPDGYLNTHTQLVEPNHRWGMNGGDDREQHDLYNAGCLVEAGVHYYLATGKTELLRVAARLANHMADVMGPPPRKNVIPGHALPEAAMVELYRLFREKPDLKRRLPFAVDERRYLELAQFWVDNRGKHEGRRDFGSYNQDHKPVVEQETIEGHAVRATLLAAGVTELASVTGRDDYRRAAGRLWQNMTARRMYVTGGLGAIAKEEKFGGDYFLPNDGYLETCAAVGAAFFHQRMNLDAGHARYADELERVLFNGALVGVSLDGNRYTYENPLEGGKNRPRWAWHACPCCPPMFLKLMGALPGYAYATGPNSLHVNLYVGSVARTRVGGNAVALRQTTRYPWAGDVRLAIEGEQAAEFDLNLRVPSWCQSASTPEELYTPAGRPADGAFTVKVNGEPATPEIADGYAKLHRKWQPGDVVDVTMQMPARRVSAHASVAATSGRVALTRGPVVYCVESADHDGRVRNLSLPDAADLRTEFRPDLLGGVAVLRAPALASFSGEPAPRPAELTAIPYYANANRAPASRRVWIPRSAAEATPATLAEAATPTASHTNPSDTLAALNDGVLPKDSADGSIPRFTWWDRRGTAEWAQYTFDKPTRLSAASVYWWDERRVDRHCRVPASWRIVYRTAAGEWAAVPNASTYATEIDQLNRVTFDPIETTGIRIEAQLQPGWSGGVLEWTVEQQPSAAPPASRPATRPATATTTIRVDARQPGRPVSKYLTGACIEDVNHEVYGGIYSQMLFGESFQEPPISSPAGGFHAFGGEWRLGDGGEMHGGGGDGPKLVSSIVAPFTDGEVGVDVYLPSTDGAGGGVRNAGLIVRAARPGVGADKFDGYEVALDAARKVVCLGRHRQDYRLLKDTPYDVPTDRWVSLAVKLTGRSIEVLVDGKSVVRLDDDRPLGAGTVGLRQWQRPARYRNLWHKTGDRRVELPFAAPPAAPAAVSSMWGPVTTRDAVLEATIDQDRPFTGVQSQRVAFARGTGEVGVENQGLNRWGMAFVAGRPYEGYVWLRSAKPLEVLASLESRDGSRTYARTALKVTGGDEWRRYDFMLTPDAADTGGRFSLRLNAPGSVVVGHAFLQPGEWGRFDGLPVRRDVVQGLIDQGATVLRYGGLMANAQEYRWKKMIGPRDRRPPYRGYWYPHSTNGWGIIDFLDVCEAAKFLAIPNFNMDESPQDMVDFMEYVNGPADSEWGRRRAADGHPAPYNLRHVQLGNEEKVDDAYYAKFERLATVIWAKDPHVVLVVGDFQYDRPILDPMRVEGAASKVTTLAAHKKILDLAKRHGREVWFDVHMWTEGPGRAPSAAAFKSYVDAIERLADGAKHRVVVFEFNANNHDHRRALANAREIGAIVRDGRVPVALSANALQPDGQNDNGWDQGLLFLNPSKVWLQPPGYVTQMVARNYQPRVADAEVVGGGDALSVTATRSEDGKQIVLQVVNTAAKPQPAGIRVDGLAPAKAVATVEELAAPLNAVNTADAPTRVVPRRAEWRHGMADGAATYVFPPHSFTVIRIE
jgi:DUF1680 family protein/alpha-L-arabinofuranosidase